jgi:hypothetical protein
MTLCIELLEGSIETSAVSKCCRARTSLWSRDVCGGSGEPCRFENTDRYRLRHSAGVLVYETSNRALTRRVACHAQYEQLRPVVHFVMCCAYGKLKTVDVARANRLIIHRWAVSAG